MSKVLSIGVISLPLILLLGYMAKNVVTDSQTNGANVETNGQSFMDQVNNNKSLQ
ncbi:hypothetical protein GCM10007939_04720 [Amylibacter marinus]|uniref:Uncharacterized protein n=1 Tax=Amylibacter marinus TaxID=1475483 RepID=A0ABQ5VSQ9_9RHOB|nr:hypothetical protein [Amylibacter marinus]GLQ34189.1 hypothetical protein GCM10007939_04720 [Amylibacter marinus]